MLLKIKEKGNFYLTSSEINSGIDIPQDFLSKSNKEKLDDSFNVGDGVFVLSNEEVLRLNLSLSEKKFLKPFYTTNNLYRYKVDEKNNYWIIYTDSSYKNPNSLLNFPNLKAHLDKFQSIITSENKPYGLNRARDEKFFIGERIIVQRKCPKKPSFVYVDFDAYFNRTFLPILTNRINLKYLVSILNSTLTAFWLRNRGKMQGDNFQVDKDPILEIPIFNASISIQYNFIELVDKILEGNRSGEDTEEWENEIDLRVYKLYELTHAEVLVIDPAFGMSAGAYEAFQSK